jgi:hypothetical protein
MLIINVIHIENSQLFTHQKMIGSAKINTYDCCLQSKKGYSLQSISSQV